MLHILVLYLCHQSYVELGKLDATIPEPKPHLTARCFLKLLAYIPFTIGLQLSYFQNVTKFIRDLLIFFYIIGSYYTFEYSLIYRLLGFELFAIFALPLILEGWIANNPSYVLYMVRFYAVYIPMFVNQFLLHENRMVQTVFFFVLIEIPSMVYQRCDRKLQHVSFPTTSYIFKLTQLPKERLAVLHCPRKSNNSATVFHRNNSGSACIELAIVHTHPDRMQAENSEWVIIARVPVSANTSDINYIAERNLIVTSACSEVKVYDANSLKLLKVFTSTRPFKRFSFSIQNGKYFSTMRKVADASSANELQIYDSIFHQPISQHKIPCDVLADNIRLLKYGNGANQKYVHVCVPSDRQNQIMITGINGYQQESKRTSSNFELSKRTQLEKCEGECEVNDLRRENNSGDYSQQQGEDFDNTSDCGCESCELLYIGNRNLWQKENTLTTKEIRSKQSRAQRIKEQKEWKLQQRIKCRQDGDVNLYEAFYHRSNLNSRHRNNIQSNNETCSYVIDESAIKDVLVHLHLLVVSCSENIVFFDLESREIIKKISTLSFDTRVHWIRIEKDFTYYLLSNEIKAWLAKQDNQTQHLTIIQHFDFYGISYIVENPQQKCLYAIYNNTLYKQQIATIDISNCILEQADEILLNQNEFISKQY